MSPFEWTFEWTSVPDRNDLWRRVEDDLLLEDVVKYSGSDVLGRDWRGVVSQLSEHLSQEVKEDYRITDTVSQLTFVFLSVTFRGSPFFRFSHVVTKEGRDTKDRVG